MRLTTLLLTLFLLLTACSGNENQANENAEQAVEEPTENTQNNQEDHEADKVGETSEEEQLIQNLPKEAHVEDWNLVLVNPWVALPEDFEPQLVEVDNEQRIDERIVDAWNSWKEAALEAGHRLFLASGHRTVERQSSNFDQQVNEYLNEGLSEEEAVERAKEYLTEPGHSEHHTGLALDIVDEEWIMEGHGLIPEYDTQDSQQWLVDTMTDYGFILRYPKGKEETTGIEYESWHFRYVGEENAKFMAENDLTLEEYVELLQLRDEQ